MLCLFGAEGATCCAAAAAAAVVPRTLTYALSDAHPSPVVLHVLFKDLGASVRHELLRDSRGVTFCQQRSATICCLTKYSTRNRVTSTFYLYRVMALIGIEYNSGRVSAFNLLAPFWAQTPVCRGSLSAGEYVSSVPVYGFST